MLDIVDSQTERFAEPGETLLPAVLAPVRLVSEEPTRDDRTELIGSRLSRLPDLPAVPAHKVSTRMVALVVFLMAAPVVVGGGLLAAGLVLYFLAL